MFDLFDQPTFSVHVNENNKDSEKILKENEYHFSKQCKEVYRHLMDGKVLTTTKALTLGIGDLRARIRDLKKINGVQISERTLENRFKEWYMSFEDINYNAGRFRV
jgi:hypothetical protein